MSNEPPSNLRIVDTPELVVEWIKAGFGKEGGDHENVSMHNGVLLETARAYMRNNVKLLGQPEEAQAYDDDQKVLGQALITFLELVICGPQVATPLEGSEAEADILGVDLESKAQSFSLAQAEAVDRTIRAMIFQFAERYTRELLPGHKVETTLLVSSPDDLPERAHGMRVEVEKPDGEPGLNATYEVSFPTTAPEYLTSVVKPDWHNRIPGTLPLEGFD